MTDTRTLPTHKRLDRLEASVADLVHMTANHHRQIDALEDDLEHLIEVIENTVSGLLIVAGQQDAALNRDEVGDGEA